MATQSAHEVSATPPVYEAAIRYAELGWRIFPVHPPEASVSSPGKQPAINGWREAATSDPDRIAGAGWFGPNNIGLACGPGSGVLVLDVDGDPGQLLPEGIDVPATVTQRTSRGRHYLFRWPDDNDKLEGLPTTIAGLWPGVDLRGAGGLIVLAPSRHPSGHQYRWQEGRAPGEIALAECPEWLIETVRRKKGNRRLRREQEAAKAEVDLPINPAQLLSALDHIDPDALGYDDWLRIIMALHHESAGSDEGLWIADQWSRRGKRYEAGEVEQRWGGFGEREQPTTQDTIFYWAGRGGWTGDYRQGEDLLPWARRERARRFLEMGQHYGVVDLSGKTRVVYRSWDGNRACWSTGFMARSDFEHLKANEFVPQETRRANGELVIRRQELAKAWLHSPKRKTYEGVKLEPRPGMIAGDRRLPDPADEPHLNLYQGLTITPRPGECAKLHRHIREVVCQGQADAYEYLLNWLARMFQYPDLPGETVPVLQSRQGGGKNIFIEPLVKAFGEHGVTVSSSEGLVGHFQDQIAHAVLVFANEALWGGDNKKEGQLKALITDETREVNRKFVPQYTVRNHVHLIVASNESWPVPTGIEDRRFVFYRLSDERIGDRAYFNALSAEINAGGIEAFVHELLERDVSDFHPGDRPKDVGDTRITAVLKSEDSWMRWWYACLNEGGIQSRIPPGCLLDHANHGAPNGKPNSWRDGDIVISKAMLRSSYREWARQRGERLEEAELSHFLRKVCGAVKSCRVRDQIEEKRTQCFTLPSLPECRALLEHYLGQKIDWDEETDEGAREDVAQSPTPVEELQEAIRGEIAKDKAIEGAAKEAAKKAIKETMRGK
nr:bifunctional DNA primase/polymerase [Halorhodospira neutriphila]